MSALSTCYVPFSKSLILQIREERNGVFKLLHLFFQHMTQWQSLHFSGQPFELLNEAVNTI